MSLCNRWLPRSFCFPGPQVEGQPDYTGWVFLSPAAELMTIQSKIAEVTGFAYDLSIRHVRDDEMPLKVINVRA